MTHSLFLSLPFLSVTFFLFISLLLCYTYTHSHTHTHTHTPTPTPTQTHRLTNGEKSRDTLCTNLISATIIYHVKNCRRFRYSEKGENISKLVLNKECFNIKYKLSKGILFFFRSKSTKNEIFKNFFRKKLIWFLSARLTLPKIHMGWKSRWWATQCFFQKLLGAGSWCVEKIQRERALIFGFCFIFIQSFLENFLRRVLF